MALADSETRQLPVLACFAGSEQVKLEGLELVPAMFALSQEYSSDQNCSSKVEEIMCKQQEQLQQIDLCLCLMNSAFYVVVVVG